METVRLVVAGAAAWISQSLRRRLNRSLCANGTALSSAKAPCSVPTQAQP